MDNAEKVIMALRITADTQQLIYNQQLLGFRRVRLKNGSWNLMRKAANLLEWKFSGQDMKDLDVIHRIRSGELKKCVCREYAIYNGDWYRDHPWNMPKEHEPHILTPDEFGECGTGWIEHWCALENEDGTLREPEVFLDRCAWCGKSLTTSEFITSLEVDRLKDYGKSVVGGFRIWGGDYAPSEKLRKAMGWNG